MVRDRDRHERTLERDFVDLNRIGIPESVLF